MFFFGEEVKHVYYLDVFLFWFQPTFERRYMGNVGKTPMTRYFLFQSHLSEMLCACFLSNVY